MQPDKQDEQARNQHAAGAEKSSDHSAEVGTRVFHFE
jgi:hypothetical protein